MLRLRRLAPGGGAPPALSDCSSTAAGDESDEEDEEDRLRRMLNEDYLSVYPHGSMAVHEDQAENVETVFVGVYDQSNTGLLIDVTKFTYRDGVQDCEDGSCAQKVIPYYAKVFGASAVSNTQCYFLLNKLES